MNDKMNTNHPQIGKDVIESLTLGMYEDVDSSTESTSKMRQMQWIKQLIIIFSKKARRPFM